MGTVTASLERSLQNCSLNQTQTTTRIRRGSSSSSSESSDIVNHQQQQQQQDDDNDNDNDDYVGGAAANASSSDDNCTLIQLNSHISLPYHWEQCLDLKTGELYYINWRTGKKVKEDPRTTATGYNGDYDSDEQDETDNDEDDESETERSSTESSCWSSQESFRSTKNRLQQQLKQAAVLVVAGCKTCLMYHMVPKHVDQCPKCCGHLLHFAANNSS
ncbi:protein CURLY FLAG LEAF 1 [Silene latifolia]|uniref:protein CURLY FLAG LEAF 1 n=1 Tax=Silene latifolia TaxID=37657 RepID=UPI003D77B2E4